MAKCTKTKQFLDPFERQTETNPPLLNRTFPIPNLPLYLRVCYSFWNRFRLIRDLEKEEGEEARCLISCALTNGWFIAASRKAWLSVTTRKTTSYPPHTRAFVIRTRWQSESAESKWEKVGRTYAPFNPFNAANRVTLYTARRHGNVNTRKDLSKGSTSNIYGRELENSRDGWLAWKSWPSRRHHAFIGLRLYSRSYV